MKIVYDPDLPVSVRPSIAQVIKDSNLSVCPCGCDEIYVSLQSEHRIDVKCYDCGNSYFELEMEIDEETVEQQ